MAIGISSAIVLLKRQKGFLILLTYSYNC